MSLTDLQNMKPKMNRLIGIKKIDIEDIKENEHNIYEQRDIEELKENIRKDGLLKPLEVYEEENCYILIGGHRRYNALLELYMDDEIDSTVSCMVYPKPGNENTELLQIITSNAQRNMSKAEMVEVTRILLKILENEPMRKPKGMETRVWIGGYLGVCGKTAQEYINVVKGKKKIHKKEKDHKLEYVESLLRSRYSTKAKVDKNKLTLYYSDLDDLNRILEIMNCLERMEEENV